MNIALVTTEFVSEKSFDGGLANYTYKLAQWLVKKGHRVVVFLPTTVNESISYEGIPIEKINIRDYTWWTNYYLGRLKLKGIISERSIIRFSLRRKSKDLKKALMKFQEKNKMDIIHYPHLVGYGFERMKNVTTIIRLSSSTLLCQQMGGYDEDDLLIDEQVKQEIEAMKRADAVFGPSKMVASFMEKEVGKKIRVIETPYIKPSVDLDDSVYKAKLAEKKYILFFGSIGLIKGVGTIAEMIFDLFEQQKDLYFVFVGKKINNKVNDIPLWDYLFKKAQNHAHRILHMESLKHPQLFPIIQHAICVVLPSRIDNFPNTCIEAMAQGKIVIGTQGNGFDQLIDQGKSGFIVPVDDPSALLQAILKTLQLPLAEKQTIEQAARTRIDLLHPDIVLQEVLDLYKQTIKEFS